MRRCGVVLVFLAAACGGAGQRQSPTLVKTTYRAISGFSMGAIGASALGLHNPEQVDAVAALGGPIDAAFFQHTMDELLLTGFCPRAELERQLTIDPVGLNDPALMSACLPPRPALMQWEHANEFNRWHATLSGGAFDRDSYVNLMTDLMLAFGNFATENPASGFVPPGVDPEAVKHFGPDFCAKPIRVKGLFNAEYNPEGRYDAITFCDGEPTLYFCRNTQAVVDFCSDLKNIATPLPVGQEAAFAASYCAAQGGAVKADLATDQLMLLDHSGYRDPCRQAVVPQGALLAYDYNGNGRRDYGEPVVNNGHERFDDVGADGCADAFEDGKGGCAATAQAGAGDPNHDNYEVDTNPNGTERDWVWSSGEPFRDDGLDGVPGTHDVGEGNGTFDQTTGRQKLFAYDGRTNFRKLTPEGRARLSVFGEGGIRDVFNFGLMAKHLMGGVQAFRDGPIGDYRAFIDIPGMYDTHRKLFTPWNHAWSRVPRDMVLLYGNDPPSDQDRIDGEGDHVGSASEALNRVAVLFNWAAQTWPSVPRPTSVTDPVGAPVRQRISWFNSTKLNAKWEYVVALPPGYDDPVNANVRYPVVYVLHGYGMAPEAFMQTSVLTDAYVTDANVQFRPMIFVFPEGRCCWVHADGRRDCREHDDAGNEFNGGSGWARECHSGTFWVNRTGYTANDGTAYGDAMFELFDYVDAHYRTLPAAEVEKR